MTARLQIDALSVHFRTEEGVVRAVQNFACAIQPGETLGLVGESGSGKSVSMRAVLQLLPGHASIGADSRALWRGDDGKVIDLLRLAAGGEALRRFRGGEIGLVFQEPMAAFSPLYTIGQHLVEVLQLHTSLRPRDARRRALAMMDRVGIPDVETRFKQYPQQLSGGMRQRAMIALALIAEPKLLIADEPTTALDVTVQAQVLALLRELGEERGMSMVFISHDLAVVSSVADQVAVLYSGALVERGDNAAVIHQPGHPYTRGLLAASPRLGSRRLQGIGGELPDPFARPAGCAFAPRCARVRALCEQPVATPQRSGAGAEVWCHLAREVTA